MLHSPEAKNHWFMQSAVDPGEAAHGTAAGMHGCAVLDSQGTAAMLHDIG